MKLVETAAELRREVDRARSQERVVALVPTMGALHEGHVSLVRSAGGAGAFTVVSIFVNPTQFGENEDLSAYPRTLEDDVRACEAAGVDLIYNPRAGEVYAPDHGSWVDVEGITAGLCAASRPGHFRGVATVVLKLFNTVRPDVAWFGRKDYQQLKVIEKMTRELDLAVEIRSGATVRDPDGLALSSRNAYLSASDRDRALAIPATLAEILARWRGGERRAGSIMDGLHERLARSVDRIDYLGLYHPEQLWEVKPASTIPDHPLAAVAAYVGRTRLIDNVQLGVDPPPL